MFTLIAGWRMLVAMSPGATFLRGARRLVAARVLTQMALGDLINQSPAAKGSASELGYDGQPLCAAAKRLPPAKKTGDTGLDQQRMVERRCLVRIVDQLIKDPRYVMPLHSNLLVMDLNASPGKGRQSWSGDYKFLTQIPRAWLGEFMLREAKRLNLNVLNSTLLSELEEDSSDNLPTLFSFMIQVPMSVQFPLASRSAIDSLSSPLPAVSHPPAIWTCAAPAATIWSSTPRPASASRCCTSAATSPFPPIMRR